MRSKSSTERWLLLPFIALFLLFWAVPFVDGLRIATQSNEIAGPTQFVGGENFRVVLRDPRYGKALRNTGLYTLCSVVVILPLALWLAYLVRQTYRKLRPFFTFVLLLPSITPPLVLGLLFLLVFHGKQGVLNQLFVLPFGGQAVNWLKDPDWILFALVVQAVWRWTGMTTFFLLCGLDGVPRQTLEAAALDGAHPRQSFWQICVPQVRPIVMFAVAYLFIDAFAMFSGAYMLLGGSGGTSDAGLLLVTYTYQTAFEPFNAFGKATAISLTTLPCILLLVGFVLVANRTWRKQAEGVSL